MNLWIRSLRKTINYIYRSFKNAAVEYLARIVLKTLSIFNNYIFNMML